jgi:hypothetical protein
MISTFKVHTREGIRTPKDHILGRKGKIVLNENNCYLAVVSNIPLS